MAGLKKAAIKFIQTKIRKIRCQVFGEGL